MFEDDTVASSPDGPEHLWDRLCAEARATAVAEPFLGPTLRADILDHDTLSAALAHVLARKLQDGNFPAEAIAPLFNTCLCAPGIIEAASRDLVSYFERDSACTDILCPFLFYKGFLATEGYRVMNRLWRDGQIYTARWVQNRISEVFGVDIHPAATIGAGLMIDHGTGIVIGETTIIEDDVSIMQNVTLGGTGKDVGDRHPVIREGVLISAGAKVLGRVEVGAKAKIGAGSVVLRSVPSRRTAVGVPAVLVGTPREPRPAQEMQHDITNEMEAKYPGPVWMLLT